MTVYLDTRPLSSPDRTNVHTIVFAAWKRGIERVRMKILSLRSTRYSDLESNKIFFKFHFASQCYLDGYLKNHTYSSSHPRERIPSFLKKCFTPSNLYLITHGR